MTHGGGELAPPCLKAMDGQGRKGRKGQKMRGWMGVIVGMCLVAGLGWGQAVGGEGDGGWNWEMLLGLFAVALAAAWNAFRQGGAWDTLSKKQQVAARIVALAVAAAWRWYGGNAAKARAGGKLGIGDRKALMGKAKEEALRDISSFKLIKEA